MNDYVKKLKDPRWQKVRLAVFERDNWICQMCGDTEMTLHVHHLYYIKDQDPWNYQLAAFVTLCESCHEAESESFNGSMSDLVIMIKQKGFLAVDLSELLEGIRAMPLLKDVNLQMMAINLMLRDKSLMRRWMKKAKNG